MHNICVLFLEDDDFVCRHVLETKLVSREAMLECLFEIAQERRANAQPGYARPLGVLLVARGLLAETDLNQILASRVSRSGAIRDISEAELGKLLVAAGLVTSEQVDECLRSQDESRRKGVAPFRLGELIVQSGRVTEGQVLRALEYRGRLHLRCPLCGVRVTAALPPANSRYRCRSCGEELTPEHAVGASGGTSLQETERGREEQFEMDRALAIYLKQKGIARRDQLRDALRLQAEFARYGLVVALLEILRRTGAISWQQQQLAATLDLSTVVRQPDWKKQAVPGYRLLARIATGGFAAIYTAEAVFDGGRVAIKILHPERTEDARAVARFRNEGRLLVALDSPLIVRGREVGIHMGRHYIVMEYVEGRSLGQAVAETGAFSVRRALETTRQIAEAIRFLHAEGYLHRDVKLDNVLIDAKGCVKLCDLGFAAPIPGAEQHGKRQTTAVGTAGYMSPEVARGEADARVGADVYSLGILLFALLTGHEPFAGASSEETVAEQIEGGLPVPNLLMVKAPLPVIRFLKRLLHPDRSRRFPAMVDAISELDLLIAG